MQERIDIRRGLDIDREPVTFEFNAKTELTPDRKKKVVEAVSRVDASVGIGIGFVHDAYLNLLKIDPTLARGIQGRPDWDVLWERAANLLSEDYQRENLGYIVSRAAPLHELRPDLYEALARREMFNSERISNHVIQTFVASVDDAFSVGDLGYAVTLLDVPLAMTTRPAVRLGTLTLEELKAKMDFEVLKPKIAQTLLNRMRVTHERVFWPGIIHSAVDLLRLDPKWFDEVIAPHFRTRSAAEGIKSWLDTYDPLKSSEVRSYLDFLDYLSTLSKHFGSMLVVNNDRMSLPETRAY